MNRAVLTITEGANSGESYDLDVSIISIGRSPSNTIVVEDRRLSRFHAEILKRGNSFYIRDLGSKNGTYLNSYQLKSEAHLKVMIRFN